MHLNLINIPSMYPNIYSMHFNPTAQSTLIFPARIPIYSIPFYQTFFPYIFLYLNSPMHFNNSSHVLQSTSIFLPRTSSRLHL